MPNDSGPDTPPSTAPTSPTSPTSTNGLIDCEKGHGHGSDIQDAECNEKSAAQGIGHYTIERIDSFQRTDQTQITHTTSIGPGA